MKDILKILNYLYSLEILLCNSNIFVGVYGIV